MKKIYTLLLAVLMMFSLTACIAPADDGGAVSAPQPESATGASLTNLNDSADHNSSGSASQTVSAAPSTTDSGESSTDGGSDTVKILVAYFSATNTTKGVANTIADCLNADIYEIAPEIPYTSADLDYHSDKSRSTIEMNDPDSRPAISGSVENMDKYDIVFIGYPIWWSEAPRILCTFAESYDFAGKTVVPFCTSGGSGVGSSAKNLEKLTSGADWLSGTRLNGGASRDSVVKWINGLGLNIAAE